MIEEVLALAQVTAGEREHRQSLIRAGLLEEISIHLFPVLAGHAFPPFEHLSGESMQRETTESIDIQEANHRSV